MQYCNACVHISHWACVEAKRQAVNHFSLIKWILEIKLRSPAWWQAPLHAEPPYQSVMYTFSLFWDKVYSPGWPRTEIHLPQPRIKGMHYHIRSIMHLKGWRPDVPSKHFGFPSMCTPQWIHCTPNKGCGQKLPSKQQGSGLSPLPVLSTLEPCVCIYHIFVGRLTISLPKWV